MISNRAEKVSAITIFLICGTISTFGTPPLTQPTSSWAASTSTRAPTTGSSSTPTCSHSVCSLAKPCVSCSTSGIRKIM